MTTLQTLGAQALLGTDKRPPAFPPDDSEIGRLLHALPGGEGNADALRLLRAAGVQAVCGDAGYTPPRTERLIPAPCPEETRQAVDKAAMIGILRRLFAEGAERPCREALRLMQKADRILPPALLPPALALGRRVPALRESIAAVAGERGRWLGLQNPAWNLFATDAGGELDPESWDHGSPIQRRTYMSAMRRKDAAKARALFEEARETADAKERAAFAECLRENLSLEDEALLESLLATDRSKEVRQIAATLLSLLPESAYARRMGERLAACIVLPEPRKGGLLDRVAAALSGPDLPEVNPPQAFDPEWKKDMVEEKKPPYEKLGQRGWWLHQLAKGTPLSWWEAHTGLTPAALFKWAQKGDWSYALLRIWWEGILRERHAVWARAYLDVVFQGGMDAMIGETRLEAAELIGILPQAEREAAMLERFPYPGPTDSPDKFAHNNDKRLIMFSHMSSLRWDEDAVFSEEGSRHLIKCLHFWARHLTDDEKMAYSGGPYALAKIAEATAGLLPFPVLDTVLEDWPRDEAGLPCCSQIHANLSASLAARKTLYLYFAGENAS
ncbi:MAG TPA: hypothetical protein H9874_05255 [Candidatus Bilophila faecipullorum]|uniref:Uncharacterized protein n=11 Tax=Bilophila TaxID=35832 RepID=A0A9D1U8X7_9BACT|nr:DUF5691 domain-containing protein [uncultured Bilophila sp.]HIW78538.1 hypothetical protein [Candidatus Bilophila faecipullorum]